MCPPFAGSKLAPCRSSHRLEFRAGHRVNMCVHLIGEHICSLSSRQAGRTAELPQSHAISEHEASMQTEPRKGSEILLLDHAAYTGSVLWLF
jgi:hypothetical protein